MKINCFALPHWHVVSTKRNLFLLPSPFFKCYAMFKTFQGAKLEQVSTAFFAYLKQLNVLAFVDFCQYSLGINRSGVWRSAAAFDWWMSLFCLKYWFVKVKRFRPKLFKLGLNLFKHHSIETLWGDKSLKLSDVTCKNRLKPLNSLELKCKVSLIELKLQPKLCKN